MAIPNPTFSIPLPVAGRRPLSERAQTAIVRFTYALCAKDRTFARQHLRAALSLARVAPTLTRHERVLLALYRSAPVETRGAVDRMIFEAWTQTPCSMRDDAPETVKLRATIQGLHADHLSGRALTGYAEFWKGGM